MLDAVRCSTNDSLNRYRQCTRELLLIALLECDSLEVIEALQIVEETNLYSDLRASVYLQILRAVLGKKVSCEVQMDLLKEASFEALEYAFQLLVLGALLNDEQMKQAGMTYIISVEQIIGDYPKMVGVDIAEYEFITPEGILSTIRNRESRDYAGRPENVLLTQLLVRMVQALPEATASELVGIKRESVAMGTLFESSSVNRSGCLSYMKEGIGVISMGPSFFPLCDLNTFGIIGQATAKSCASFQKQFPNGKTEIGWMHWTKKEQGEFLSLVFRTIAPEELYPMALCVFIKAEEVAIQGGITLKPKTLDKYQDVVRAIHCKGDGKIFTINPSHRGEMQVIPLAGGAHFFGADFLLAFVIGGERENLVLDMG